MKFEFNQELIKQNQESQKQIDELKKTISSYQEIIEKLQKEGIYTIGQLAHADLGYIQGILGNKFGQHVHNYANGIDEDPVCGSMFCALAPFWKQKLGKAKMVCRQVSKRGGTVYCEVKGERVNISGKGSLYSKASICVDEE